MTQEEYKEYKELKYQKICEATEKAKNDEWYSARHEVRMRKIRELEEEDRIDWEKTRSEYLRKAGFKSMDEEPDPFKRIFLRGMMFVRSHKKAERA